MLSTREKFSRISAVIVGCVFWISGVAKAVDPVRFGRQIELILYSFGFKESYNLIIFSLICGLFIITCELVIGSMLIISYRQRMASLISIGLILTFMVILVWAAVSGLNEDCGCFGHVVKRSALAGFIEDVIFLGFAYIAFRGKQTKTTVSLKLTQGLIAVGFLWCIFFIFNPPVTCAARPGIPWVPFEEDSLHLKTREALIWVMDPDCDHCQEDIEKLNSLYDPASTPELIGITSESPGRINEFIWDFEPKFQIIRVTEKEMERIFLPTGSLVFIRDGIIIKVWRPFEVRTNSIQLKEYFNK